MSPRWLLALFFSLLPAVASAHGGLPVSTEIVWRGKTMYVPTQYWGIFVGAEDGPWRWICDEAINSYKLREVYLGGDDTFYATDLSGLTLSHDGGCTWAAVTGEMARRDVSAIVPDPQVPAAVWVTTVESGQTALWRSQDSGGTFEQVYLAVGQAQRGLSVSPDGKRLYLTALSVGMQPAPVLLVSPDGGKSFTSKPLLPTPAFLRVVPLGVDPRDPAVVYLLVQGDPTQILLRSNSDGATTELLRLELPIFGVTVDVAKDRLLIPTGDGLYLADGAAAPRRSPALSRAQCASVRDGKVFACSWNYYPDLAALARSGDDGASFGKIFQYAETKGVLECPAGSTVARTCPQVWATYASLLGIDVPGQMEVPEPPPSGCGGCVTSRASPAPLAALPVLLLGLLRLRRRRHR